LLEAALLKYSTLLHQVGNLGKYTPYTKARRENWTYQGQLEHRGMTKFPVLWTANAIDPGGDATRDFSLNGKCRL